MFDDFTGVFELDDHHTIDYLVNCVENILNKWGISTDKVHAVITDGAANIVGAVKKMFGEAKHLYCFAHMLNLIVNAAVNDEKNSKLTTAIEKLKKIVTWFHQSVVAADQLKKVTNLKLIQSVPTRWNSVLSMVERYLEISDNVASVLLNNAKSPDILTYEENEFLREFVAIFKVFEEITIKIQSETVVTVSQIIPFSRYIMSHIENQPVNTLPAKLVLVLLP